MGLFEDPLKGKHSLLRRSPAERLALLQSLMDPNVYDDDGNVIGLQEPLLTAEEGRKLLEEMANCPGVASEDQFVAEVRRRMDSALRSAWRAEGLSPSETVEEK